MGIQTERVITNRPGHGRELELLRALNAAAASLQRSAHSETAVYHAFKQQIGRLGLRGGISLLDETGQRLTFQATAYPGQLLARMESFTGFKAEGFSFDYAKVDAYRQVVESGEPVYVANSGSVTAQILPRLPQRIATIVLRVFGSPPAIFAPLIFDGRVRGLLNVSGPGLVPTDVPTLAAFANHIAIALTNARLFAATQQAEAQYRRLFESAGDGILLIDPCTGQILSVNHRTVEMTGYPEDELLTMPVTTLHPPELLAEAQNRFETVRDHGQDIFELPLRRLDGHDLIVQVSARMFEANGRSLMQSMMRDITEQKAAEAALREREEQLRQAQKLESVGQLAAGIAHDFNNLLTVINGFAALLQYDLPSQAPHQESVSKILDAGQRAADLVRQLLAFSRKQIIEPQVLSLNNVVTNMDTILRRIVTEDISLQADLAPDLWPVRIDPVQIEQVIINLALNARDAMPAGGRLEIETGNVVLEPTSADGWPHLEPGEYVRLAIRDTGTGMSPEVKAHLFEPFFTTKEVGRGTGLGLATVFGIVKQNGGDIQVETQEEVGSAFHIFLPRVIEPEFAEPAVDAEPGMPSGGETILLVEDDAGVRELVRQVLLGQGYTLLEAQGPREALQIVAGHAAPIHLLLTDVVMPGMSGTALAGQIAATQPRMKILYMSGYADDTIIRHGVPDSEVAFLPKPFSPTALAQHVRKVLDV